MLKKRKSLIVIILAILSIGGIIASISFGAVHFTLREIMEIIFLQEPHSSANVIWNIRLPRIIVAIFVGINLAVSGAILQAVMKNPLADPGIIGITSGAGLAGIIILIILPSMEQSLPLAAFIGALLAALMIYILAWKDGIQPARVILAGVGISAFFGAIISGLMIFHSDKVHGALMWMSGSLAARSWVHVKMIIPYSIIGVTVALVMARNINTMLLGDEVAHGLGVHVEKNRLILVTTAVLLAASAVSVVGLLGFVGLIVPHATRLMIGNDYRYLLPGSMLLGIIIMTLSDTFARVAFSPIEIPVGIVMACVGAPFFLYLLRRA